ncbi:VOC family protein [Arthrobacter bambusae]|uniref:VOC family protein n=1 Tax=Arthrobacter bambusae TaxID=1338426 RepID=UPI002789AD30|nr:VOC family protein [Arthrobacter bambusae]MDQ0028714.1 catechol 2,3-dioxygenase-like lactoylglutathione lyase family enzyme [Arthrobacter bambusae]MDQ0096492.1 catechol 2,3-dioxygenase-like lactoylglutathione lyase family enzyme [Arthrobacter bambusae]
MILDQSTVDVRYLVRDVQQALDFYTTHLGFTVLTTALPAFADAQRGNLRLILSGPASSGGRPLPDGTVPQPGGWNRIHFIVDDLDAEVARLQEAGIRFRSAVISGPGGRQAVFDDPSGNPVELFAPADAR